jgi:4,5-dihydroxyphthalate decarboxylase
MELTLACGRYDRTQPLIDARVRVEGVELNYLALRPGETFWRMLNNEEFDASEMSLSSYNILRSKGDERFIAIPVFPSRIFRHSGIYLREDSPVRAPADLKGRRIGVGDYQMTAAVWIRGFLQHDYGVKPEDVRWLAGRGVRPIAAPPGVVLEHTREDLEELLLRGEIDALASVMIPKRLGRGIRRLFPNYREVEAEYYRRTRIFPIMHTLVLRRAVYDAHPWLAVSLYKAFCRAKDVASEWLYDTDALPVALPWIIDEVERSRDVAWDYSIDGSRPTLQALVAYANEQGLTEKRLPIEDLFAPNIRPEMGHYLHATGEQ